MRTLYIMDILVHSNLDNMKSTRRRVLATGILFGLGGCSQISDPERDLKEGSEEAWTFEKPLVVEYTESDKALQFDRLVQPNDTQES